MALSEGWFVNMVEELKLALKSAASDDEKDKILASYIERIESRESINVPEFDSNLEWLNCTEPLSFENRLCGKLCILDFFTYCCINCMHILPDLEALEHRHSEKDGVVIIGVHSAKFENEKSSTNILSAILRYDIRHPVVNDFEAKLWNALSVQCWPTLVVVSPDGKILLSLVGEGHKQTLLDFTGFALKHYRQKGKISSHSIGVSLAKDTLPRSSLSFPCKICTDKRGERMAIADTGHHRIVIVNEEGVISHIVGAQGMFEPGFRDGSLQEARFHTPQGVAFKDELIFVADTENHAIRRIDLVKGEVTTVAGTGEQGTDKEGGETGTNQSISSPWDVVLGPSPGPQSTANDGNKDVLYIAMAGTHQIWVLYLEDGTWLKGGSQTQGTCLRFAGSGAEENCNNSYPHKAGFAQPSGITFAMETKLHCLFVADSESSSVRTVDVITGGTKALVGADRDPTNLFAFGDQDGKGVDAKLQHPLGVAWNPHSQLLFVADSYNHKIKLVDPQKKTCDTFCGTGKPGLSSESGGIQFDEPGGLCVSADGRLLYVADTNNHSIRVIDINTKNVSQLNIVENPQLSKDKADGQSRNSPLSVVKRLTSKRTPVTCQQAVHVTGGASLEARLNISFPEGCYLTKGATSRWQVSVLTKDQEKLNILEPFKVEPRSGDISEESLCAVCKMSLPQEEWPKNAVLWIEAVIYFCEPSGTCRMDQFVYEFPLVRTQSESMTELQLSHECKL